MAISKEAKSLGMSWEKEYGYSQYSIEHCCREPEACADSAVAVAAVNK